jgi:tetratricopeptide (TPR) repeat protein
VLALFAAMLWKLRDNAKMAFSGLWVLIALIPVLNLESVGQNVFAERYLYIPSAGLCLLIPALAERYARSLSVGGVQIAASAIIAGLALLTVARNPVWRDEKTFYTSTLAVSPDASMMHQNLGRVYYQEKNLSAALAEFEAARSAAGRAFIPSLSDTYNALVGISTVHADVGRLEDAWQTASEAKLLDGTRAEAFFILGTIRSRQQRDAEAEPLLKRAVTLNPSDSAARVNLGSILLFLGKPGEAEEQFRSALAVNPDLLPGLLGLAMCREQMGRHAEAIMMLKEVLVREPGNSVALQLLSKINSKK